MKNINIEQLNYVSGGAQLVEVTVIIKYMQEALLESYYLENQDNILGKTLTEINDGLINKFTEKYNISPANREVPYQPVAAKLID